MTSVGPSGIKMCLGIKAVIWVLTICFCSQAVMGETISDALNLTTYLFSDNSYDLRIRPLYTQSAVVCKFMDIKSKNVEKKPYKLAEMKCPKCEVEAGESNKFCQSCGFKFEQKANPQHVVICGGELDDGSFCSEELTEKQRFCPSCGQKVDQSRFKITVICGGELDDGSPCSEELKEKQRFCQACGQKVDQARFKIADQKQNQSVCIKSSKDKDVGESKSDVSETVVEDLGKETISQHLTDTLAPTDRSLNTDNNTKQTPAQPGDLLTGAQCSLASTESKMQEGYEVKDKDVRESKSYVSETVIGDMGKETIAQHLTDTVAPTDRSLKTDDNTKQTPSQPGDLLTGAQCSLASTESNMQEGYEGKDKDVVESKSDVSETVVADVAKENITQHSTDTFAPTDISLKTDDNTKQTPAQPGDLLTGAQCRLASTESKMQEGCEVKDKDVRESKSYVSETVIGYMGKETIAQHSTDTVAPTDRSLKTDDNTKQTPAQPGDLLTGAQCSLASTDSNMQEGYEGKDKDVVESKSDVSETVVADVVKENIAQHSTDTFAPTDISLKTDDNTKQTPAQPGDLLTGAQCSLASTESKMQEGCEGKDKDVGKSKSDVSKTVVADVVKETIAKHSTDTFAPTDRCLKTDDNTKQTPAQPGDLLTRAQCSIASAESKMQEGCEGKDKDVGESKSDVSETVVADVVKETIAQYSTDTFAPTDRSLKTDDNTNQTPAQPGDLLTGAQCSRASEESKMQEGCEGHEEGTIVDDPEQPEKASIENKNKDTLTKTHKENRSNITGESPVIRTFVKQGPQETENKGKQSQAKTKVSKPKYEDLKKQNQLQSRSGLSTIKQGNTSHSRSKVGKTILVHFHVLVSEDFKLDAKENQLVFRSEIFGEFQEDIVFPKQKNNLEKVLSYEIPCIKITDGKTIQYKYCIRSSDLKPSYTFEYYKNTQKSGKHDNRTLTIPYKWKEKDEWHQYDGFIEREPGWYSKLYKRVFTSADLVQHANTSVETYCTKIWQHMRNDLGIQEGLDQLEIMMSCLKRVYFSENRLWTNETDFKREIGGRLVRTITDLLSKDLRNKKTTYANAEKNVVLSLAAVCMVHSVGVDVSEEIAQLLCNALILKPNKETKECPELKLAERYFKRVELKDAFVYLATQMVEKSKNPSWLLIMPWIHFLSDAIKPYQVLEVDLSHDNVKPKWWGHADLVEGIVRKFNSHKQKWEIPVESMIDQLLPLFEMDFLLPRTLMTCVELNTFKRAIQTKQIPLEICLATLIFYLKTTRAIYNGYHGFGKETTDELVMKDCTGSLLECLKEYVYSAEQNIARWEMCFRFSATLLKESTFTDIMETMLLCAQIAVHCLAMFHTTVEASDAQTCLTNVKDLTSMVIGWLRQWGTVWRGHMEQNLKVWDTTLAPIGLPSEKVRDVWNKTMTSTLLHTLHYEIGGDRGRASDFVKLYCEKSDNFHPVMQESLSKIAFETITNGYNIDYGRWDQCCARRFGDLLSKMFNTEWRKAVGDNQETTDTILHHVLHWMPFLHFLKIRDKDQDKLKLFQVECIERMIQAVSVVEMVVKNLLDGSINIDTLNVIGVPENRFDEIAEHVMKEKKQTKDFILKAVKIRKLEIGAFKKQAAYMTILISLCERLKNLDRKNVDQTLDKQSNIEKHCLNEFLKPAVIEQVEDVATFTPSMCAFEVGPEVIAILPELHRCNQSNTFLHLWSQKRKGLEDEPLTLEDVVETLWQPVKQSWDSLAMQIWSGEITFQQMEKLVGGTYHDNYEHMKQELGHMDVPKEIGDERLDQLKQYRHLNTCVKGAKAILKFSREYELKGNFDDIDIIASHGKKDLEMKFFDTNLIQTCEILEGLTEERSQCLEKFVQCTPLVKWLQASMSSTGLKELKVFVDLAFMSAGEEPINIKRVQCLHSAVTGYAPLIFDLKPEADYKELLSKCELVWVELKTNTALPEQLMDTNRQLEWLKDVKKAHGSVEVTSLFQADAINTCGIYTVGNRSWKNDPTMEKTEGLMKVLQLKVSEVEGKRQMRNYNFSHLQDLQSRLMLVAGKAEKGSEGVEIFTSVFDSIVRLSKVYLQLCSTGCVLFKGWTAKFLCEQETPVCIILEFGDTSDAPELKGRRTDREDLKEMIPQLANFMEKCYEDWLRYIKEKRAEYLHLNFFTVDQLVILQRELVKYGTDDGPSHRVYPLLSAVKQDCTPADMVSAMTDARASLQHTEMEHEAEANATVKQEVEVTEEARLRETFIEEITIAGYDRMLAEQALEHDVSADDVSAGILWCIEHHEEMSGKGEDSDVNMEPMEGAVAETARSIFPGWNSDSNSSLQTMITSNICSITKNQSGMGFEPLKKDLQLLWEGFLSSLTSNVKDYLSLEHLGLILRFLAKTNRFSVDRSLPPGYEEGAPNLLVCPSADVLPMVLTVYMMNTTQPLPQPDEVLVCTQKTTIDEVDIFWQRALFGDTRKMHCLANVDLLDYDVSDVAERQLEEYRQSGRAVSNYKLVVICGSDNENRSKIVSSLDKFRRSALYFNLQDIQLYLAETLQVCEQSEGGIKPASFVDFSNSSVRLVKSWRAGVGKTLYKARQEKALAVLNPGNKSGGSVSIPLQEKNVDIHYVMERLLQHIALPGQSLPKIFHFDVAHEVQGGVDFLLFNLLVLGCVVDRTGYVWRKSQTDLYLIETMPLMTQGNSQKAGDDMQYVHKMLSILPDLTCRSPQESLEIYNKKQQGATSDQLFDNDQFRSPVFQRPFQNLWRHDKAENLQSVDPNTVAADPQTCLETLLRHCGIKDPSWAELHHFVWFLNTQLQAYETNNFVCFAAADALPGFANFVLRFLINMSRDFSNRSLNMSEQSPGVLYEHQQQHQDTADIALYQMRRTWESSPHPYLFINYDSTFTFLGFNIEKGTFNMIDQQTGKVLEKAIMKKDLYEALVRQNVPIQENFDALSRKKKIKKLSSVMGLTKTHDPDDTYELTTDNVKKIMAIYMRFKCDIPVIIMGETGCGKTRLIKFMCSLQMPPEEEATNMILMKVHGGTTNIDIKRKVEEAERVAKQNQEMYGDQVFTVLFFDEANTTEAIGLIKEIMCDKTLEGKKLTLCENLKIVAACNPYRKHSNDLIKKLEQAGLGYHVDADDTADKLGRVPMRRLVYRVQPLPQSLLPLVWDFGQLNTQVEDLYIRQMVRRYVMKGELSDEDGFKEVVSSILTASQEYMRQQNNECSFVSLRDVERVLSVMSWFYQQSQGTRTLFNLMDEDDSGDEEGDGERMEEKTLRKAELDDITRSLVLALGVCYHACLRDREDYRNVVTEFFKDPCPLPGGAVVMEREITRCQDVFLESVQLEKNIARNMALKENVFMMTVCIELRIPLFLVGKPGSSKSLAKTIVSDAMQGNASREQLFKELKQAQMVSFQCSPLATPEGIVGTFRQCAQFQEDKDLDKFVSTVVLDEVGLAEDSPRMPLKTLHPLLEDGCQGDEKPEEYKKVAFIGISNWALDPAKMNRGILVQREVPDLDELKNSARGICTTDDNEDVLRRIEPLIKPMAESYLEIFNKASKEKREFYGLRDFYSLVKMVYAFTEKSKTDPTWHEMKHAVLRNFGGLDQVDPVQSFRNHLSRVRPLDEKKRPSDPDCSPKGLLEEACLFDKNKMQGESRYLLLLTENYGALNILQQKIIAGQSDIRSITIFGSSFRCDQEYTQVCRNINKIKVCMETGNRVILLNLENLYESLYDALNQYYVYFGGERYVDLGLGTHRVKCPVHRNFRLIVVAEKQTVYDKFPIPLINRLEKHFLTVSNMLTPWQHEFVDRLEEWAKHFVNSNSTPHNASKETIHVSKVSDVFMGYHDDTCSAIVMHTWPANLDNIEDSDLENVLLESKKLLLWSATPDAVVRLTKTKLGLQEQRMMQKIYNEEQTHESIAQYLNHMLTRECRKELLAQVTTHSKLLPSAHKKELSEATNIPAARIMLLDTLSSFDTEQQFSNKIQQFLKQRADGASMLIVQCDAGDKNANLVACARYCVMDEIENVRKELKAPVHVVFIIQIPRIAEGCFTGFQCGVWHSVHIDDLRSTDADMPTLQDMVGVPVSALLYAAVRQTESMETENSTEAPSTIHGAKALEWEAGKMPPDYARVQHAPSTGNEVTYELSSVPLNNEEVVVGRASVGQQPKFEEQVPRKNLNVQNLILTCVQAALSMVKDREDNKARTTERVPLVLKLFNQNTGKKELLNGIVRIIASLMKDKESNMLSANQWLRDEAAKSENIQNAGNFRRSCLQIMESKISPILAGIIAYLDTNQNLDILQKAQSSWQQDVWLSVLNTPNAIPLKYADLQSPKRQNDLPEVIVMTTGCDGHMFSGNMPFSWLIRRQLDDLLNKAIIHGDEDRDDIDIEQTINRYVDVLSGSGIGKILDQTQDLQTVNAAVQAYLADFIHMVYRFTSEEEFTLVSQLIMYMASQMTANERLLARLVSIHLAYRNLEPRLVYFHTMNCVWPECSQKIIARNDKNPNMFREEEFTMSALCLLIEDLAPGKTTLNESASRFQWLQKVYRYRQVIEKVISLHTEDPERYFEKSLDAVLRARCLWSRVVVVKLFLEHVCASEDKDAITIKHCMPLWALLGEKTNLKEAKSLGSVENFLKSCNKSAIKEFMGQVETCCVCERVLEGPPMVLGCNHILCDTCLQDIQERGETTCPKCKKDFKSDWNPVRQTKNSQANQNLQDYQKRCNSFFMDTVSQLCFSEDEAPSDAVIDKLLKLVLCPRMSTGDAATKKFVTKEMSIFDTGIDPTPVFRSFLLQLMMRTSREMVTEYLRKYLDDAGMFLNREEEEDQKNSHWVSLGMLIIQCFEDILLKEATSAAEEYVKAGIACLHRAAQTIDTDKLTVEKLCGLAEARIGLVITAKFVADIVSQCQTMVEPGVRRLIEAAEFLSTNLRTKTPRTYLVKYICRRYGMDTYQKVCRSQLQFLRWIPIADTDERVECADMYVVCGKVYTQIREALTQVILSEDMKHLGDAFKGGQGHLEVMLQLAVYREITNSNLYPPERRNVTVRVIHNIEEYLINHDMVKNKNRIQALLHNRLSGNHLVVQRGEPFGLQGVQCLVIHFLSVLDQLQGDGTLMQPLICLMKSPQTYQDAFLPTMPQDDLDEEIREIILAGRKERQDYNISIYVCPNGHPYVIGNCGGAMVVSKCPACGEDIGGTNHTLLETNTEYKGPVEAATGHFLGQADARGPGPNSERALTPLQCACLRLLIHMAMYAGTIEHCQGIEALIHPHIDADTGPEFLWQHIIVDLDDIKRGVGKSEDDVLLLMHAIINTIMTTHNPDEYARTDTIQLKVKHGRTDWEQQFSLKYLKPVLQDIDTTLNQTNQMILKDQRLGADPLLCLLYEKNVTQDVVQPGMLQDDPTVWRYRTPISLEHLRHELETKLGNVTTHDNQQLEVLQHFLKEDHYLRAIRYIPNIQKLHRILLSKYIRRLDKEEASIIQIGHLKRDDATNEIASLVEEFKQAWELLREDIKKYVCPTELGGMVVSKEYCSRGITDDLPIAYLLPTTKGMGLCSYALLDFLMRKQNNFLTEYMKATGRNKDLAPPVSPKDITTAHLISYDPDHDILPLVLANCKYSFEMGTGTTIDYDFQGLERQLMDRFLFSKSRINIEKTLNIELMAYRAEVTNDLVFKKLGEKIPQEVLSRAVKVQISSEIQDLPDVCTSLDKLDIAISFLSSVGGEPEHNLYDFMYATLKMENSLTSQKARQECQFQHAQSLWLHLSLMKSKQIADHHKPRESMFDNIEKKYHQTLPDDLLVLFKDYMKRMSVEKLSQLVEILHEYIVLQLSVPDNTAVEDYVDTAYKELSGWLYGYIEDIDRPSLNTQILDEFPGEILMCHCSHTWTEAYTMLHEKKTGQRH